MRYVFFRRDTEGSVLLSIPLERHKNVLVLPDLRPKQRYLICPAEDANCWHILPTKLNNQWLRHLADTANRGHKHRLKLMTQGTYQDLERQGNLLLLPAPPHQQQTWQPICLKAGKKNLPTQQANIFEPVEHLGR